MNILPSCTRLSLKGCAPGTLIRSIDHPPGTWGLVFTVPCLENTPKALLLFYEEHGPIYHIYAGNKNPYVLSYDADPNIEIIQESMLNSPIASASTQRGTIIRDDAQWLMYVSGYNNSGEFHDGVADLKKHELIDFPASVMQFVSFGAWKVSASLNLENAEKREILYTHEIKPE